MSWTNNLTFLEAEIEILPGSTPLGVTFADFNKKRCTHAETLIVRPGIGTIYCGQCKTEVSLTEANVIWDAAERNSPGMAYKFGINR